jgi:hypothetical protein
VYKPKIREEEVQKLDIDPERTTNFDIIQIGTIDVPIEESGKRPVVLNNLVVTPTQKGSIAANDHEASGSKSSSEYFLPRWCPPGLTHTQMRKLQRLRLHEKRENELEKQRDEVFNSYRPMMPQGKEWRPKMAPQTEAVRPLEGAVQPPKAVRPANHTIRLGSPKMPPGFTSSVPMETRYRLSLLQRTTRSLWTTVLLQSG